MEGSQYRNRLVVFRLTEEEYGGLKRTCAEQGARNLSEFTRTRVLGEANTGPASDLLRTRFAAIESQLLGLRDALERLNQLIQGGPRAAHPSQPEPQDARL